jgi:RNA methyltransferase, TrmH family
MIIDKVTSRQNPLVKRFRTVRQGRERHLIFIEGVRLVEEVLRAEIRIETVAYTEQLQASERGERLYEQLKKLPCRGAVVTDNVMAAISDVETPQGVAAIAHLPYASLDDAIRSKSALIVVAHQLQDPGNLGTIIRTAEAAGADSVIVTHGTVDPFNLKALRASMGSAFRLPLISNVRLPELVDFCRKNGLKLIAAEAEGGRPYSDFDWKTPVAVLLGQEASGLDKSAAALVDERLSIPMLAGVESLNVATAAAVLLYEAARQKGFKFSD